MKYPGLRASPRPGVKTQASRPEPVAFRPPLGTEPPGCWLHEATLLFDSFTTEESGDNSGPRRGPIHPARVRNSSPSLKKFKAAPAAGQPAFATTVNLGSLPVIFVPRFRHL